MLMRLVGEWIAFELIWLLLMVALGTAWLVVIATAFLRSWGILSLLDWTLIVIIAIFFALLGLVAFQSESATKKRHSVTLQFLTVPLGFLVFLWPAFSSILRPIRWVPVGLVMIVSVLSIALIRPLIFLIYPWTIGQIPEHKKFWRLSAITLLILVQVSLVFIALAILFRWASRL